jgi:hypothetical protein
VRSSFLEVLRAGLECAESTDPKWRLVPGYFMPGDADHIKRWLSDPRRAAAIFAKLTKQEKLTQRGMIDHIHAVLGARRLAEDFDKLNVTFAELERDTPRLSKKERRHALRQFADGKVSQEALDAYLAFIDEVEAGPVSNLDPLFTVRSDRAGSRKQTIFCRILSKLIHINFGCWHDAEVAALCEIAFDCGDVTIDMVRAARRGAIMTTALTGK